MAQELSEEFDLFEIAGTNRTHGEMQSDLQPLTKAEPPIHRLRHQWNYVSARLEPARN